jgi:uncharacterized membrane protein YozB (DUF420 family)
MTSIGMVLGGSVSLVGGLASSAPHVLVHLNAALNLTAAVLLLAGYALIRARREAAHKRIMLAAFGVSTAFLVSYLWYHANVGSVMFTHTGTPRTVYLAILASHIVLAFSVPPLAIITIYTGYKAFGGGPVEVALRYRRRHRRWARWTFPIWLYVSITGVIVYVMLYHLYPPLAE